MRQKLFEATGPDEDGNAWWVATGDEDVEVLLLGPVEQVAEAMATWLESLDR